MVYRTCQRIHGEGFRLVHDEGHPQYNYDKEHYHIECEPFIYLSQSDIEYLIKDVLEIDFNGYLSYHYPMGGHIHFFEDEETMQEILVKLQNLLSEDDGQEYIQEDIREVLSL